MDRTVGSRTLLATVALVLLTAVWGSTFFIIRDLVEQIPSADFLAVRFAIAALIMLAFFHRQVCALEAAHVRVAFILGLLYAGGQLLQTIGLEHTSASVSGFVTGMYVVFTPILGALIFRDHIGPTAWAAVLLAAAGLGVLSLRGFALGPGETLTLAAAGMYALHILGAGRWSRPQIAVGLAAVQAVVIAAVTGVAAAPHGLELPSTTQQWTAVLYMATAASVGALLIQTWAQAHMSATRAAITMTLEPVFAAAFAIAFGGEHLGSRIVVGGLMILTAMYIVELAGRRGRTPVEIHHEAP